MKASHALMLIALTVCVIVQGIIQFFYYLAQWVIDVVNKKVK